MPQQVDLVGDETPLMGGRLNTQHNDSIFQSSVNQSINSGLGLTPKRLVNDKPSAPSPKVKMPPFGSVTDQKQSRRVPPILLANQN